ncbi:HPr kinase/phosphorylase [Roseomonas elaeocarpi]|uniref:HPr kinase/phosphorylase n=1 Tax=Roseomonas elaeocarpi TaxID=907779 RepID=A0ABV6JYL6_9PROT
MRQHGSCACQPGPMGGVLLLGAPGSGKSDLLLRLLDRPGWRLVGDDQLILRRDGDALRAQAASPLRGMLEVRGLGLLEGLTHEDEAALGLAVECVGRDAVPRLPVPRRWEALGVTLPVVAIDAHAASAPRLVELALQGASGTGTGWRAGAFEAEARPAGRDEAAPHPAADGAPA